MKNTDSCNFLTYHCNLITFAAIPAQFIFLQHIIFPATCSLSSKQNNHDVVLRKRLTQNTYLYSSTTKTPWTRHNQPFTLLYTIHIFTKQK